jgi:hypothetical protein
MIEINLPIRLQSPNVKEHWTKTHKRNKRIAQVIGFSLRTNFELFRFARNEGVATMIWFNDKKLAKAFKLRISLIKKGRAFDYDNMVYSFKIARDVISSFFYPGLKPGQADSKDCFIFEYLQEKGGSGIKIILDFIPTEAPC